MVGRVYPLPTGWLEDNSSPYRAVSRYFLSLQDIGKIAPQLTGWLCGIFIPYTAGVFPLPVRLIDGTSSHRRVYLPHHGYWEVICAAYTVVRRQFIIPTGYVGKYFHSLMGGLYFFFLHVDRQACVYFPYLQSSQGTC
jgi:hypothetical protein